MTRTLSRLLTDYGMIFVLALLCLFFSVATYSEQSSTGEVAEALLALALVFTTLTVVGQTPKIALLVGAVMVRKEKVATPGIRGSTMAVPVPSRV